MEGELAEGVGLQAPRHVDSYSLLDLSHIQSCLFSLLSVMKSYLSIFLSPWAAARAKNSFAPEFFSELKARLMSDEIVFPTLTE